MSPGAAARASAKAVAIACSAVIALAVLGTPARALSGSRQAVVAPALSVTAAGLIVQGTGQRLYGRDPDGQHPIASTTKIMTALVTLEHVNRLGTIFTQNNYVPAASDSQIGLVPGERMSVHDLLVALLLPSADDAAEDLAYNVGHGSVGRFVAMMNTRARQLGLINTHYSTPIGLDTPGNYSSAMDLVTLASYVLGHSRFFARTVAQPSAVLHSGRFTRVVKNRNDLVARVPWIDGVKTGHTLGAGYVLVASGHRNGMTLIGAVLGTSSESARDANALSLLNYGFDAFHIVHPVQMGAVFARPTVRDRPGVHADVIAGGSFTRIVARSARVRTRLHVPRQLTGPLPRRAIVGELDVFVGRHRASRIPLLLAHRLRAVSPLAVAGRFLTRSTTLLVLAGVLGLGLLAVVVYRLRAAHARSRMPQAQGDRLEAG